nr:MAG TPA: hypothetical protein [Crassvirales sp.]
MNENMNDIDDILQDLNMEVPVENPNSSQDSTPTEETNISLVAIAVAIDLAINKK